MMFDELAKMLSEIIQKTCVTLQELAQQLSRLLGSASDEQSSLPFWKPYHCRVCGRRYMTAREAGLCVKGHQKSISRMNAHGKVHGKHTGLRVAPRNREATMRSTEVRRYKQTIGSSERR